METPSTLDSLRQACRELAGHLLQTDTKVVFAESCTAGLISAGLAEVPGISAVLCGSAVTYRNDSKLRWLAVSPEDLARFTAVSEAVTRQMAEGVLRETPEADVAAAVTGHLGPDAPAGQDGKLFVSVLFRRQSPEQALTSRFALEQRSRIARQREAAMLAVNFLLENCRSSDA